MIGVKNPIEMKKNTREERERLNTHCFLSSFLKMVDFKDPRRRGCPGEGSFAAKRESVYGVWIRGLDAGLQTLHGIGA